MSTDLPPQIQNIQSTPAYAVIELYAPNRSVECANNQPISEQRLPDPEHFGGYSVNETGTARASVASGTTQNMTNGWVPWEGKIPSLLVQFDYEAHTLEIRPEIRK